MSDRLVRYIIVADGSQAVRAFKDVAGASELTGNKLETTGKKLKSFGSEMISLGRSLSYVSLPIAAIGYEAVKSALSFEKAMNLVRVQAGASAKEVGKLSKEVLELGAKGGHGFGPNELAEALYPIRSDGFKAAEAMKVLNAASAGAAVGQASLSLTANALGGAIRTYGGGAKAAAQDMNILNATVGFGKFKLEELDDALTSGFLVQAHKSGIGLKEIGTALDSLARKSVPPQVEATRLQKTLIQFESTSGIAEKSLARIGISQYQLSENMKKHGLISTLEEVREHLKRVGSGAEAEAIEGAILGEAFGRSKGSANVGALLQAIPEMRKVEQEKKHYNTLSEALAVTEGKSYYKIKIAIAEVRTALISLGNTLIPIVIPMFEKLVKLVGGVAEWFAKLPKPIKEVGVYFGIALVVGGPLLIFFGNIIKAGGTLLGLLGKLTKILPEFGAAAGEAGTEASLGITGLVTEMAPLIAATAAIVAGYEAVKALKSFFSSGESGGKTPAARALGRFHQPSNFTAATGGALHMLAGGPSRVNFAGLAPGSAAEAQYLKEHAGAQGQTTLGGHAAGETAQGRELRKLLSERNEIILHLHLDGKQLTATVAKEIRDQPQSRAAKHMAEGVVRTGLTVAARGAH